MISISDPTGIKVLATPNPTINSQDITDDFGRPYQHVRAGSSTETSYDANGRVSCVTNPHYSSPSSTDGSTCTSSYDGLDRPLTQTQPDNNTLTWSYPGNTVVSIDEAGHSWQRTSDAFGRLTKVVEPNSAETDYTHSMFTITVSQKGVSGETPRPNRTFTADSLGRTVSVNEPESGTTTYGYDNNGNQTSKTDARNVITNSTYDALNRLTFYSSSDGTPNRIYAYDQTSFWMGPQYNTIGRLSESHSDTDIRYASSVPNPNPIYNWSEELYSYDAMGRTTRIGAAFPSESGHAAHEVDVPYDLAGNRTSLRYPDGRVVTQGFDGGGRLQNVVYDNWNGQHVGYTYASGFTYTPAGAQTEVWFGNGLYIHTPYNNRQQMCQVWSNSTQGWIDTHIYYGSEIFCNSTPGNNGSITEVKDWKNSNRTQHFGYDSLNRVASFNNGDNSMNQTYSYDSFGNLKQLGGTLGGPNCCDVNNRTNETGFNYDSAGDLTHTEVAGIDATYSFDAAGRVFNINSGGAFYTYDGNGNRVRKDLADGRDTEYQYLNGVPIAEAHSEGIWSDYIYANGQLIARSDSHDVRIHFTGTNCSNCGPNATAYNIPLPAYTIQAGDKIAWRQYQTGPAVPRGGLGIRFTDDVYTNWVTYDQDGRAMNNDDTQNAWHYRVADLSQYAGKTIAAAWINADSWTGAGHWEEYFSDIAFYRTDGTVVPIYHRQQGISYPSFGYGGVTNQTFEVNINPEGAYPMNTTTYYIGDQIGSARMTFVAAGWPVESSTFYPFGQEQSPSASPDHYKFAMLERDGESGLDHATFRQYSPSMGRWMSPDPYLGSYDFADPQSFNRYGYVGNRPLSLADPSGLEPFTISVLAYCGGASGACAASGSNPVTAIALGAVFVGAVIADLFTGGFFAHPAFHGSLKPRPNAPDQQKCSVSSGSLDNYLQTKGSPMQGIGADLMSNGQTYNLDPRLLTSLAGAESGFGTNITGGQYNAWNWLWNKGTLNSPFQSWQTGAKSVAKGLSKNYDLTSTSTLYAKYCTTGKTCPQGLQNLNTFMKQQGADPNSLKYPCKREGE